MCKNYALSLCLLCTSFYFSYSQNQLIVSLNSGQSVEHAVGDIRSIKFSASSLILNFYSSVPEEYAISDISHYEFYPLNQLAKDSQNDENGFFAVYHNQTSNQLSVMYSCDDKDFINIELNDLSGRIMSSIYNGLHNGQRTYSIQIALAAGIYLVIVTRGRGIITKPFIIQ